MIQQAIERITQMERCFDLLRSIAQRGPEEPNNGAGELLALLEGYYESGQWLRDYELDEQGLLPRELKRGVLAQDALYDFLENYPQGEKER